MVEATSAGLAAGLVASGELLVDVVRSKIVRFAGRASPTTSRSSMPCSSSTTASAT
jgi:hypothetical protein